MNNAKVVAIFISPEAGAPMESVDSVMALKGRGLEGDRYASGEGSFNKEKIGNRQVTLINSIFFEGMNFEYKDSRRNIVTEGVELMYLIGREFKIGDAIFKGVKYCDPCQRPSNLSGKPGFRDAFLDRGGLVAEIIESGSISVGSNIIPPPKGY